MLWTRPRTVAPALLALALASSAASGQVPLHERIDQAIEAPLEGRFAPPATDGEFLRRATLDLNGRVPNPEETRAFLDDPSPYKRARLVEALLERPEYARRMQTVFDVLYLNRMPDKHISVKDWRNFLRNAFAKNIPYDQIAREILGADGADDAKRPAAKFILDREADPALLTRDIGRIFLGRDMQCAQCHDHPLVDAYKQAHYYGIYAFLSRSSMVLDAAGKAIVGEKADGVVNFTSVFKKKVTHTTGPRILDGKPLTETEAPKGDEYVVAPADKVRSVPRVSRRDHLPGMLAGGAVPEFDRTIANRLWALMMGRGIVHPLDLDHPDNPPSHPELLDLLTKEFAAGKRDVKAFLRELALTRTYQRSSEPPPGVSESDLAPSRFAVAAIRPLTGEQLGYAYLAATGMVEANRTEVEYQVFGRDPRLKQLFSLDRKREAQAKVMLEDALWERVEPHINAFLTYFAASEDPTVHQALFLANGGNPQAYLAPAGNWLVGRLNAIQDPAALADELYVSVLNRRPTADEKAEAARYLAEQVDPKAKDRNTDRIRVIQGLAWALLSSSEFRFNH